MSSGSDDISYKHGLQLTVHTMSLSSLFVYSYLNFTLITIDNIFTTVNESKCFVKP